MLIVHGKVESFAECALAETGFLKGLIGALRDDCRAVSDRTTMLVINGFEPNVRNLELGNEDSIAFIFDENGTLYPDVVRRVRAVFQAYIPDDRLIASNHHSFPLGPAFGFDPGLPKPIADRPHNLFFIGNLHRGRTDFYRWLSGMALPFPILARMQRWSQRRFDSVFGPSYIRFTDGFAAGLSRTDYANQLAASKIVLCPGGSVSVESFRLYEAMMAGCIVIAERLPERAWFDGAPVIQIDRWSEAVPIIRGLLNDPDEMARLSKRTSDWYRDHIGAAALARRICSLLNGN